MKGPNDKHATTVVYKSDMLIMSNDSGVSCHDKIYCVVSILLALAFYGAIPLGMIVSSGYYWLMLTWLVYFCWSACHASTSYVQHLVNLDQMFKNIDAAIRAPPEINFHIECYHYGVKIKGFNDKQDRHAERGDDSDDRTITHKAVSPFVFHKWEDRSPPANVLHFLSVLCLTRLHTYKVFQYSSRASHSFTQQKAAFIHKNDRDDFFDYSLTEEIPYHSSYSLVFNEEEGKKPWYVSAALMAVMDLFMVGWIVRLKLNANTKIVKYKLEKYIIH